MKELNAIQKMMLDTGMLEIKLPVTHDTTEYEVKINADCICDFCQESGTEEEMHFVGDNTICEACFEHYN